MKFNKFILAPVIAAALTVVSAQAAHYEVDAGHSQVGFRIRHLVTKLPGEFKEFEGKFDFDEKKPQDAKVTFKVKTASINTNNEKRDEHLRGDEFFDAEKHPELTFVSKKVKPAGKGKYKIEGDLTLHGVTKPVTFDAEFGGIAKDPWGNTKAGFNATAKINRKDFGISWNKALDAGGFVIGDEVELNIAVEAAQK